MTTIAYRDGVMAGDSLITSDNVRCGYMRKIARRDDGALCGVCGSASLLRAILAWFLSGEPADGRPQITDNDACFIIVRTNGRVESHDQRGFSDDTAPFFALGSGRELAMGAMAAGATAIEAVRAAAKLDIRTGGTVSHVVGKQKKRK